ncbi:MAG: protein-disulfide reductase DsbD, partial [Rubrivivax sp.]
MPMNFFLRRALRGLIAWPLAALMLMLHGLAGAQDFLPPEQAFRVVMQQSPEGQLLAGFKVAPGYYLYRERMEVRWQALGAAGAVQSIAIGLPTGEKKHDPTFDKVMEVYHQDVVARLPLPAGTQADGELTLVYQGCADAGICYPPQTRRYQVAVGPQGEVIGVDGRSLPVAHAAEATGGPGSNLADTAQGDATARALASGQWLTIIPVFLLAGVLLSLTPCVLPMVPILSSIIVGQAGTTTEGAVGRGRGFALALSYSQGMALVYTALGVAAGWVG